MSKNLIVNKKMTIQQFYRHQLEPYNFYLNKNWDIDDLRINKISYLNSDRIEFDILVRVYDSGWLPFSKPKKTDRFSNLIIRVPIDGTLYSKIKNVSFETEEEAREAVFCMTRGNQKKTEEWIKI